MPIECRDLESFLPAYVDGEFELREAAEIEAHLGACAACANAVRVQEGLKGALRRSAPASAPPALRQAVLAHLLEEKSASWKRALGARSMLLVAALAGAAVWLLAGGLPRASFSAARAPHSLLLDDGVALHARGLPLDYTASDIASVQQWLQGRLDFAVRVPRFPRGAPLQAALQGARLSPMHARQGALLAYTVPPGRSRLSVVIVDDPEPNLPGISRRIADREVWLTRARGYNVVSWRSNEIVYSLISDLDEAEVLQLARAMELH